MKLTVIMLLSLLGLATYSCTKSQDPVAQAPTAATNQGLAKLPEVTLASDQSLYPELVKAMVSDQLVKDYVLADVDYTTRYATWYHGLSADEKQARDNAVNDAINAGTAPSDPVHSQEEITRYLNAQNERNAAIRAKYPQLNKLSEEEFANVQVRVFRAFTVGMPAFSRGSSGCVEGYYACKAAGGSAGGCTAGYYACIAASPPGSW